MQQQIKNVMSDTKKKILIVCKGFYPQNSPRAFRATELAKEFARQGHDVTVLTPKNNEKHLSFEKEHGVIIKDLGKIRWKQIELKGKGFSLYVRRALKRLLKLLFEYPDIELKNMVRRSLKNENGYDLMISIAVPYPIHWGVASVRSPKKPIAELWVADCGDPYMGAENDSFKKPVYFEYYENKFFKKADYISIPIEDARNAYSRKSQKKIIVIPQGLTFPQIKNKVTRNEVITFLYAGEITSYQHYAIPFFKLLKSLDSNFKFVIHTKNEEFYKAHLKEIWDKIEIYPYIDRIDLIHKMTEMDFLIYFPYKNKSQLSLKIVDYSYSGRPIFSYSGTRKDEELFMNFINKDYSKQYINIDTNKYKIENVANKFLSLI